MLFLFFLLLYLPFIFCQSSDFACNGIRNDFILKDGQANVTLLKGNFDFFTSKTDDGKTKLVIKSLEITYNVNDTVYINFSVGANFYNNIYFDKCYYQEINNSICYISDMGLISVSGNYWNAISEQDCLIVAIFLNIDYGIINLSNGTYIGVANGNDLYENSTSSTYFFPFMNSYCISYTRLPSVNPLLPKCNQIISDVMFYNVSNNYSVVASVNIIFELGLKMNVKGMFRPSTESFSFRLNDEGYSE